MKYMQFSLVVFGVMLLYFSINGCFVIGTAIGSSAAKKENSKRPIIKPEMEAINDLETRTWVELVRKDSKKIEGEYLETNIELIPIIKLKMPGKKAPQIIPLNDIDYIVVGHKSSNPQLTGTLIGLGVDGILWTIIAVAINKAISP